MKITKILKARKSIAMPQLLYVDIELSWGVIIKGMIYNCKKNEVYLPQNRTESGKCYTPFVLLPELKKSLLEQFLEMIQEIPMPKETEEVTHEEREAILAKYAIFKAKRKVPGRPSGQKEDPSAPSPVAGKELPPAKSC